MRLFCIPFAGGTAVVYHGWQKSLPDSITVDFLELAGRGIRFSESLQPSIKQMAVDIYQRIAGIKEPYAIFGHSMGGLLAYEAVKLLQAADQLLPQQIFLSACEPPEHRIKNQIDITLPDKKFMQEVVELGGTPEEILEHEEFIQLLAPILKNDFLAIENYQYEEAKEKIKSPVMLLSGKQDTEIHETIRNWQAYCENPCDFREFEGGHFFIQTQEKEVLQLLVERLGQSVQ